MAQQAGFQTCRVIINIGIGDNIGICKKYGAITKVLTDHWCVKPLISGPLTFARGMSSLLHFSHTTGYAGHSFSSCSYIKWKKNTSLKHSPFWSYFVERHFTNTNTWTCQVTSLVVSIRTQAVKLYKNFDHFKYSLRKNKKNIPDEYSLSQVRETIYNLTEQTCIETTDNLSQDLQHRFSNPPPSFVVILTTLLFLT